MCRLSICQVRAEFPCVHFKCEADPLLRLGLIHNAEKEGTIELVSNMVLSHIQGNCLILVTIPMTGTRFKCAQKLVKPER